MGSRKIKPRKRGRTVKMTPETLAIVQQQIQRFRHGAAVGRLRLLRLLSDDGPGGRKGEKQQNRTCGPSNYLHREDSIK